MAKLAGQIKVEVKTFVRKDESTGMWRLYFGESMEDYDFYLTVGSADPATDEGTAKVVRDAKERIGKLVDRCLNDAEFVF